MEITRYIDNGKVKRDRIVADIKRGRITNEDVQKLLDEPDIQDAFFGNGFNKNNDQSDWDSEYLDELALVSVSETFNREYLLFLSDVAAYLLDKEKKTENKKKRMQFIIGCIVLLVILGALAVFITSKSKNKEGTSEKSKVVSSVYLDMFKTLA